MIEGVASGLRAWGPVIVWMALMFTLSTDLGSMANTSRFLEPLLRLLAPQMSPETFAAVHFALRKAAHLTEYAILAVLVRRALDRAAVAFAWKWGPELFAWVWAVAFAVSDELHQAFVDSRGPSARDVLIDAAGAAIGLAVAAAARTRRVARSGD